jgi:hypothetical protein
MWLMQKVLETKPTLGGRKKLVRGASTSCTVHQIDKNLVAHFSLNASISTKRLAKIIKN